MCSTQVLCPKCGSNDIKNFGYSTNNVPRYLCCNNECETKTFMLKYRYKAYEPGVKEEVVNMAINGIDLKSDANIHVGLVCQEAELDEQWSYVHDKSNQRWLWYAVDHATNTVLAYVFGKRKDEVFKKLKVLLEPFGIKKFYTDDWGAYERHLDEDKHTVGKKKTQKIERKNLNLRTWIKRLARKTICFSKIEKMPAIPADHLAPCKTKPAA